MASELEDVRAAACLAVVQYGGKTLVPELTRRALEDESLVAAAALCALEHVDATRFAETRAHAATRSDSAEIEAHRERWREHRRV
jgi:hypothetical protein